MLNNNILGFEINKNDIFLGLGHKARQGKDTVGLIMEKELEQYPNTNFVLLKFVDGLIEELKNSLLNCKRKFAHYIQKKSTEEVETYGWNNLIYAIQSENELIYQVADKIFYDNDRYLYKIFKSDEVSKLHDIFQKRNITSYKNMVERDPEMMQFWGVDFRRAQDENYWIKKTLLKIKQIQEKTSANSRNFFIFTDLRFKNEYDIIKKLGGYYIKIIRLNEDGTQFISIDRDTNHISENDLNDIFPDYIISAESHDLNSLFEQTKKITKQIIEEKELW